MTWQLMLKAVRDGTFFRDLGKLKPDELADRLRWAPLFTTARLSGWLTQDDWAFESAIPLGDEAVNPILAVLLERHLLNLDTRFDPEPLFGFWDRVVAASRCNGKIASLWRDNEGILRSCCNVGEPDLKGIVTQEKTFAKLLHDAKGVLRKGPSKLQWASDTVGRLADRRSGGEGGRVTRRAYARVVFVLDGTLPAEFRPALLADLELRDQGVGEPNVTPAEPFHATFRGAADFVARLIKRRRFHRLKLQPISEAIRVPGGPQQDIQFPPCYLQGVSGGYSILLAQILANRRVGRWRGRWYALPPWVVASVALDEMAEERACPVGGIETKIRLLREEGVRLVVVADEQPQLDAVKRVKDQFSGRHGIKTLEVGGSLPSAEQVADRLITDKCAWEADIEKPPLITRRTAIVATVTAGLGLATGAYLFSDRRPQTLAMRLHSQAMLRRKAEEVKRHAAQSGIDSYFRDVLKATEIKPVPVWGVSAAGLGASPFGGGPLPTVGAVRAATTLYLIDGRLSHRQAPAETAFRGLKILLDSKFFDSTDWAEVASLDELSRRPIEPAYFTRVLTLQKEPHSPTVVAVEFNTGGLCVVPVVNESRGDKVYYCTKPMDESKAPGKLTRTTYLVIDISQMGNDGQPFDLVVNAIWFNGAQDQRLRFYEDGPKKGQRVDHDWWGTRVCPGAARADLAIRLPNSRSFGPVTHWVRKEDETGRLVPFREVKEGDPLWAPAWHLKGTYTEGPVSVWVIPCEGDEQQDFRWIYSLQWKWE